MKITYKQKIGKERRLKKRLERECDQAWFEKHIEENCEVCGYSGRLQCHHFFPKSLYPQLRFDDDNAITLCMSCHFLHHHRGDPTIHQAIIENRGQKWYQKLLKKSQEKLKPSYKTIPYLENQLQLLKAEINQ